MKTIKQRFLEKINKRTPNGCWEWIGGCNEYGYGRFWNGDRMVMAHRFSCKLFKDLIPEGKIVCHTCDNPRCVNPDHLWLGTQKENIRDAIRKGRLDPKELNQPRGDNHWSRKHPERMNQSCGDNHYCSKLTEKIVMEAREEYSSGTSIVVLANKYGVTDVAMGNAIHRKTWKCVV